MSILIKDMKMPVDCWDCPCINGENCYCQLSKEYVYGDVPRSCPLIELSDHGDLIDKDELMKHVVYIPQDGGHLPVVYMSYAKAAKTVIPAERSEE